MADKAQAVWVAVDNQIKDVEITGQNDKHHHIRKLWGGYGGKNDVQ